jgi:hypothetical protein
MLTGREIGYQHRVFDLLDERPLNKDEIREFCELLFGPDMFVDAPDVHEDWTGFCTVLTAAQKYETYHWNPIKKKVMPWIDVAQLKRAFRGGFWGLFKSKRKGSF